MHTEEYSEERGRWANEILVEIAQCFGVDGIRGNILLKIPLLCIFIT